METATGFPAGVLTVMRLLLFLNPKAEILLPQINVLAAEVLTVTRLLLLLNPKAEILLPQINVLAAEVLTVMRLLLLSNLKAEILLPHKCFSGGSYDGYDSDYFDYPIPYIEITNAVNFLFYSQTTAQISGTNNSNVLGQLGWLNDRFPGITNWFARGFSTEVTDLVEGSNTITVIGANYLSNYVSDSVIIYRETFQDVHPFIKITNAPAEIAYNISTAEISGTNLNIAGEMWWTNSLSGGAGTVPISNFQFQVSINHGNNLITVFGTNIYGHSTNDVVCIHRKTWDDVHPFMKITNAPSEVAYNISAAEISGTNLNIAGEMWWTNSLTADAGTVPISNFQFQVSIDHGDNFITISGTNIYGHSTNDVVCIHRKTWDEVHPFIKITNAPAEVAYNIFAAEISGTDLNIAGEMWWTNSLTSDSGTIPISNFNFQVSIDHGDNFITIFGTNIYGHSTNDVVCIHRKTWIESAPQIATNALIFPASNSVVWAPYPTNIIWDVSKITDDIDGTNLTITKISVHVSETTNEVSIITNNINNLLGEILWMVPAELIGSETNYVLNFEVVDSSSLTNSRIFWDNKFIIIPEPFLFIIIMSLIIIRILR